MAKRTYQNYILLPRTGVRFPAGEPTSTTLSTLAKLTVNTQLDDVLDGDLTNQAVVLDTTGTTGAKLIRLAESELPELRAQLPGLRIVPEVFYFPQRWRYEVRRKPTPLANQPQVTIRIRLTEARTNRPVAGAIVVAFTDFEQREGEQATSDAQGVVRFRSVGNRKLEQFFVYPKAGLWSLWRKNITLKNNDVLQLQPVKLDVPDAKGFFYPMVPEGEPAGRGVKVGVIDTGTGPHPDLVIAGGASTVTGDEPTDFADVDEHGTHVAGIIAARGTPPTGVRGVAPEVDLYVYRVFGRGSEGASNFAIIKAIEQAVADGCDIINMSLGGGSPDDATEDAITFAHENGTVCFVATGNDGREPVSFPASFSLSLAVGAMGRKGTFPANTTDAPNVAAPYGTDKKNFVAAFSNVGPEVDFIAPGVGIVSSVPGGYAPFSGTSMACPMAAGIAARLLSAEPAILSLPRNAARAEAMIRLLAANVQSLGFGPTFEGTGMLFV
ncbi:peptidase S8/S53 subtilisin kexin sedolisin [Fibrisoma montanum]|uniref:Peptidase S8/S53 subtilisin kexin sedolisin n=1 Tax=Fibrisoma montanum TaxID=2305895 RepID=A0A418MDW7_9BACT|nr:S8 family serine peptidase [Fibrisoma montanum]RIV24927.1 peptidase S8/S53 subtilisin kexin sedolisin [Fibrisoma montanum]